MSEFPDNLPRYFPIAREPASLSFEDFYQKYYLTEQPVLIEGIGRDWPANQKWTQQYLYEELSNDPNAKSTPLWYWMDREGMSKDYTTPDIVNGLYESDNIFPRDDSMRIWIHQKGHSSNWHYDTNLVNVFNAQITGRKEWFMISPQTPPISYPFSNFSVLGASDAKRCKGRIHTHFYLEVGDMLYIPPLWYHKVLSHEAENINVNWLFTNRSTEVNSPLLGRELERYIIQEFFEENRWAFVRKGYKRFHDWLPNYLRYKWRFDEMIKTPYRESRLKLLARFIKEIPATANTLWNIREVVASTKQYKVLPKLNNKNASTSGY